MQQATYVKADFQAFNLKWDRVQLVVYFAQETALSMLYIFQTYKHLKDIFPLQQRFWSLSSSTTTSQSNEQFAVLRHLAIVNIFIIALDITLLGIQCADLFYLQASLKPCIYGIKLKIEFAILNRLIRILQRRQPSRQGAYIQSNEVISNSFGIPIPNNEQDNRNLDGDKDNGEESLFISEKNNKRTNTNTSTDL